MTRLFDTSGSTDERGSALWGTGKGGDGRGRVAVVLLGAILALAAFSGTALAGNAKNAFVPNALATKAQANPTATFTVIVRGRPGQNSASIAKDFAASAPLGKIKRQFYSINGVAGQLTGAQLTKLAQNNHVLSITPDIKMRSTGLEESSLWKPTTNAETTLGSPLSPAPQTPGIAIVDSGIDPSKAADWGTRLVAAVNFSSADPADVMDRTGHGTMVASLAAGSGLYSGVAPTSPIVALRTADATGASRTSDVVAACDWLLQNAATYNIKVANFSMAGAAPSSFRFDPLDAAVERLWFKGITVVAAVGNYGTGAAMDVTAAPGNDPFVISVGATDTNGTASPSDDTVPSWSAYGRTLDGFNKPEISAPGRWITAAVPMDGSIPTAVPDRIVAPGYMWMSGTSLSAPMVAGAAAQILARHPSWTPDQVKGALMVSSSATAGGMAAGMGELNVGAAVAVTDPPNPQSNLDAFVTTAADGTTSFDGPSWVAAVTSVTNWEATNWEATNWEATNWEATNWEATNWEATNWEATNWEATNWEATNWEATNWEATNWEATLFAP